MEGEMFYVGRIFYACLYIVILVSIVGVVIFIEKGSNLSSWLRNILAAIAGIGASLASLFMVYVLGGIVYFNTSNFLSDSSMTDEIGTTKQSELSFSLSLIDISVLAFGIFVSMLGGYLAGKVARQNEIAYGFLIGLWLVFFAVRFEDGYFAGHLINNLDLVFIHTVRVCSTVLGGSIAFFERTRNQANLTTHGRA